MQKLLLSSKEKLETLAALNENSNALRNLADSGEMASAALEEMDRIQQRNAAGASIMKN